MVARGFADQVAEDLVDASRRSRGKLNYSTSGVGTILIFAPQLLFDVLKLGKDAAAQIAYKGGSEAALARAVAATSSSAAAT